MSTESSAGTSRRRLLASYAAIAMPMAAMGMPIAVYLPRFYAEVVGLSLATVGMIFTAARLFDVVTDPLMGVAIDRFDSRWGRRKHWAALSIPLLCLAVWKVFLPDVDAAPGALYLTFWLLVLYAAYTMLTIAHLSWGAELATGYDARSELYGWREIFTIAGMTLVLALPAALELAGEQSQEGKVASMGFFCLVLFPVLVVPLLRYVPDSREQSQSSLPLKAALKLLVGNPLLWRLLAADLLAGLGTAVSGALYIFVAIAYFRLPSHASLALLFYFLAGFLCMPLWLRLAYRYGKDRTLKGALVYAAAVNLILMATATPESVLGLWGFTIAFGLAFGAAPTLLRSMMADLTDEDELKSGQKRAGLYFALLTTTNKLGAALGVGLSFTILDWAFGFVPGTQNDAAALDGLLLTYALGTAGGLLLAALPLLTYPMTREKHGEIVAALRAREAATGAPGAGD